MGHDLAFPFHMVKRGRRAVYVPGARAVEKMVPTIEGEWRRKRRMMSHAWPIVVRGGLLDPRGYGPLYGLMIALAPGAALRDAAAARAVALATLALLPRAAVVRARRAAAQAALLGAARRPAARVRVAPAAAWRATTCSPPPSLAAGLYDCLRHGTAAGWDAPEGTR